MEVGSRLFEVGSEYVAGRDPWRWVALWTESGEISNYENAAHSLLTGTAVATVR